jgi:hypothetical protein
LVIFFSRLLVSFFIVLFWYMFVLISCFVLGFFFSSFDLFEFYFYYCHLIWFLFYISINVMISVL